MKKKLFHYHLPDELIAQVPLEKRDQSRLLVCDAQTNFISDHFFHQLPLILEDVFQLKKNSSKVLFIANNSRVYPARVRIQRKSGGRGEVFFLEKGNKPSWACLLRPKNKLKKGEILYSDCEQKIPLFFVTQIEDPHISLVCDKSIDEVLNLYGEMPLPPYIARDPKRGMQKNDLDKNRYQTVYSDFHQTGSCAAPTAGLHFSDEIIQKCEQYGGEFSYVTLHIGLGTFAPVQVEDIHHHNIHEEHYIVNTETILKICEFLKNNWPIVFIGTTAFRAVESFFRLKGLDEQKVKKWAKENVLKEVLLEQSNRWLSTKLFFYPKDENSRTLPCIGNAILTNFHQPESTLVLLVAALMGYDFWKKFYNHAIGLGYRFFSYGDSSLLFFRGIK